MFRIALFSGRSAASRRAARLPARLPALLVALVAVTTALTACSDDKDAPTADASAGQNGDSTSGDLDATGDALEAADTTGLGACPPPAASATAVRARKLGCLGDLPTGNMAAARVGDIVLENHLVRFVLRTGANGSATLGLVGGNIVDAVRLGPDGKQLGGDSLREWIPTLGFYLVKPDKIEIITDGSNGEARVRVSGGLAPFQTAIAFLGMDKPNLVAFHEFVLRPGSSSLEIRTTAKPSDGKVDTSIIGDVVYWGGRLGLYRPGSGAPDSGFDATGKPTVLGLTPLRADADLMAHALGFTATVSIVDAAGILAFLQPMGKGVPVTGKTFVRRLIVGGAGEPSLAAAMAEAGALAGRKYGVLAGKVDGMWSGVQVELMNQDGRPLTRCAVRSSGEFSCPAPLQTKGVRTLWVGNGQGQAGGGGQTTAVIATQVSVGATTKVSLQAPLAARLKVRVRSDQGEAIPFQARLIPVGKGGKGVNRGGRTFVDGDGDATFVLPPGAWQIWLQHGPEWSIYQESVTLIAGETLSVDAKLRHVMPTAGWIACDMHIHAEHSLDSEVPNRERILDAVSVSLDYVVATDHDFVTDYQPWVDAAGLTKRITVASGVEVSTSKYGHHNVWPIKPDPSKSGNGAPSWYGLDAVELAALLRGNDPKRVVQANHPRDRTSYFRGIGFDPKKPNETDKKLLAFDAVELINNKKVSDTLEVLTDWFSLLDEGISPTGVANSDAHTLTSGVGSARTWVWVGLTKDGKTGRDRQGVFTAADADAAIRAGRAIASTGPLLTLALHAGAQVARIGDTLSGASGEIEARVVVLAPDWLPLGMVEIYRNGLLVHSEAAAKAPVNQGLRTLKITFKAKAATKKGWWTAMLKPGKSTAVPVVTRPVWAIANPVFEVN